MTVWVIKYTCGLGTDISEECVESDTQLGAYMKFKGEHPDAFVQDIKWLHTGDCNKKIRPE